MSRLRTAVNKAVEVGNSKNITQTVRNYADSVVQQAGQAVAEGAKLFQDRIVNTSLAAAQARLHNATEERDQFGEANNQIIAHLKTKDDDLSKSVVACKKEAEVIQTWINFLEDTWLLQCSYTKTTDKRTLKDDRREKELFNDMEKSRQEFESIARPTLEKELK